LSRAISASSRRARLGVLLALLALAGGAVLVGRLWTGAVPRAAGASTPGEPSPYTDASVPARNVTMIGSSPEEAAGETWGLGTHEGHATLVRYTQAQGWTLGGVLLDSSGQPLANFQLDHPEAGRYPFPSPLAGEMTADGGGVLAGTVGSGKTAEQALLVRDPGGSFEQTQALPGSGEAALSAGEQLLSQNRAPLVAALEESSGHAGALIVPVDEESGKENRVLHWNGESWSSEPIEVPVASSEEFQVLAIASSSPQDSWLLAKLSNNYPTGSVALFRRRPEGEGATWKPVRIKSGGEAGEPLFAPLSEGRTGSFTVPRPDQSQVLTVTSEGVWIDGLRPDADATTTMYFKPTGELAGELSASWCAVPEGSPAGTEPCTHSLPRALTSARIRSFAWANPSQPQGERVITGFAEGVSLSLEGSEFEVVPALGGSAPPFDVGGTFGSAFSSPSEGWLGNVGLAVHLTTTPPPRRLTPWPTAFSRALLALAPAPGQAVGSAASEVLAVGDRGEVARYEPGRGWVPESLLGPGGRHETPRLRAVAWPTPKRAYAVGDFGATHQSQMWLWRGETGLWEPDPATPLNFRGNLLGIAFDPGNPARGYAVGQSGVLLSYGKTWSQEQNLPAEVAGASFTSIAFAGSEAIVAYRKLIPSTERYEGGLIVNDGSGWSVDEGAAAAIAPYAPGDAPWAVAALSDGGAAFSTDDGQIFERQSPGAPWQATSTPYPGADSPGSLSLFREGGALRVIAVGSIDTHELSETEDQASAPPGFPPTLVLPYPISSSQEQGVLRQTATGWSDEEHELNNVEEPEGEYSVYDTVYQPDPVSALLVDPSGSPGWAVGGIVDNGNAQMDTADVWRYWPAGGEVPTGESQVPIPSEPIEHESEDATFLVGGGARCEAPCAERSNAAIGPDVWLSNALQLAGRKIAVGAGSRPTILGARAFLYTGPRVTTGKTAGPATLTVPYLSELERYGQVLDTGLSSDPEHPLQAYPAPSSSDLDLAHSEASFESAFNEFPQPLGGGAYSASLTPAGASTEGCAATAGCQVGYYAIESTGVSGGSSNPVRVIVLDNTADVDATQLAWLGGQLSNAEARDEPAIVVGNANLQAQKSAGDQRAREVVETLVAGNASAYFFDAPEQNLEVTLRSGSGSVPSYGSGTLGYESFAAQEESDFIGPSGFLLTHVGPRRKPKSLQFPVTVRLIPNIGELAMEAEQGTLLRRSEVAQFQALARRPRSGNDAAKGSTTPQTDPYIPIPFNCVGTDCKENEGLFPEYTFTSSNPKVGTFVKPDLQVSASTVEEGPGGRPIPDSHSGLFCALEKGQTTVTITAGGLSASLEVTVQSGSLRQPCLPLTPVEPKTASTQVPSTTPPKQAEPAPTSAGPTLAPVPLPAPPSPAPTPAKPTPPAPFFSPQPLAAFVPAFVPPPIPTPARPTPPSGTSAVNSPVEATEKEEEEEAAPESVSNEAVAYRQTEHEPAPAFLLGFLVLAAFAGATVRRRPGRGGRKIEVAPATITAMRTERRNASLRRRRP
jgi:hypothetical protein